MIALLYNLLAAFLAVVVVSCTIFYIFLKNRYQYWQRLGVPGPEPQMLFGNIKPLVKVEMTDAEHSEHLYKNWSNEEYFGFYSLWQPTLFIRDLQLVRKVFEKDFDYFSERPGMVVNVKTDSLMINLFSLAGNIWKSRRMAFSKMFTPKKLKDYTDDMQRSLGYFMKDLEARAGQDLEISPLVKKHIIRSVCNQLYGLDLSHDEKRIAMISESTEVFARPPPLTILKLLMNTIAPHVMKIFKIPVLPAYIYEYFAALTNELVTARKKIDSNRNDVLDLIIKLREEIGVDNKVMRFEEAVGHIYILFQASFDTTELTTCHALLQLALNPEVQEKARQEVDAVLKGSKTVTYEHTSEMHYLEAIITETLRIFPPVGVLDRLCTKPYKVNDRLTIPKGTVVHIAVSSIQKDPSYYPEPHKFMPERFFNKEGNKDAWLPFGAGPRVCIGMRLGRLSLKLTLAHILSEYVVLPSDKMALPMKFDPNGMVFSVRPIGGFHIKLQKRL